MTATEFISNHLNNDSLLSIEKVDTVCAFTGIRIDRGVSLKNILSSNFTDTSYVRYQSLYCSVSVAKCMSPIAPDNRSSLRNYSFFATESELQILKRDTLYNAVVGHKKVPFILVVSYNSKKHISYKTRVQYNGENFTVFTDSGEVEVRASDLLLLMPILDSWYSVVRGKETTTTQPTYFTKDEILTGVISQAKILAYGIDRFFTENHTLEIYRSLPILKLLVFILKKTITND